MPRLAASSPPPREIDAEQELEGDLYRLIIVLAATGARFSQVRRLLVRDSQRAANRLMMPTSRKGKGEKPDRTPVPVGKYVLDALLPTEHGRAASEWLLVRRRYERASGRLGWE